MPSITMTPKQAATFGALDAAANTARQRANDYVTAILDGSALVPPPNVAVDVPTCTISWPDPAPLKLEGG